jgi:hypothetical protein
MKIGHDPVDAGLLKGAKGELRARNPENGGKRLGQLLRERT